MTLATKPALLEEARLLYRAQRATRLAADEADRAANRQRAIEDMVGTVRAVLGVVVAPDAVAIRMDGDDLPVARVVIEDGVAVERAGNHSLRIIWPCATCARVVVRGADFRDLAGLGWALEERVTDDGFDTCYACRQEARSATRAAASPEPTVEERLVAALRAFVAVEWAD